MASKLRTRRHKVVLNRSAGGDAGITVMLVFLGAFMFLPMYYDAASLILAQADAMGYKPAFFGVDGMDGILTLENFDVSLAEGVMLLTPFSADAEDDLTKNFVKVYQEKHGEVPNQFAADAYDCVYAIYQACQKAGVSAGMSAQDTAKKMVAYLKS